MELIMLFQQPKGITMRLRKQVRINGKLVGIVMKEAVRRALGAIRNELHVMEIKGKLDYSGNEGDVVTTCDEAAQTVYVKVLKGCFPQLGIIAEEDDLLMPCTLQGIDAYFTIDAVDGTRALTRLQSKGIGTMLSLVVNEKVIAAFVGDVMTQEIYGYRPADEEEAVFVYRISEFETAKIMKIEADRLLSDQYVLLQDRLERYSPLAQQLCCTEQGLFKGIQVEGGSIGIGMAQLWKGELGGTILRPSYETPWDSSPVFGISLQMGFLFYTINGNQVHRFDPKPFKEVFMREEELLIIHQSRESELEKLLTDLR